MVRRSCTKCHNSDNCQNHKVSRRVMINDWYTSILLIDTCLSFFQLWLWWLWDLKPKLAELPMLPKPISTCCWLKGFRWIALFIARFWKAAYLLVSVSLLYLVCAFQLWKSFSKWCLTMALKRLFCKFTVVLLPPTTLHHRFCRRFRCYRWPECGSSVGFGLLWAKVGKWYLSLSGFRKFGLLIILMCWG